MPSQPSPLFSRFSRFQKEHPLGIRLLAAILVCSSLVTLIATASQLYIDYRTERSLIDERIRQIEASYLDSLSASLWAINPDQVQLQLEGIRQLPDVVYLQLDTQFKERFVSGTPPTSNKGLVERQYRLSHTPEAGRTFDLGQLKLVVSLDELYQRLADRVLVILASQAIKTFLVSAFILFIFHYLVTQHLGALARHARRLRLDQLDPPLSLARTSPDQQDELGEVVDAFNEMRKRLQQDMTRREQAEKALEELNEALEQRVKDRTLALESANQELHATLARLRSTQARLVESEKLAALGDLVAGVAHEISTPIGIGYTAASFLEQEAAGTNCDHPAEAERLKATTLESSRLIGQHLERAAKLVSAFKQVSVDQSSEQRRQFALKTYLEEILLSLQPRLKRLPIEVAIDCSDDLLLDSYPGAVYQVFSNLILNSVIHGFADQREGRINIVAKKADGVAQICYRDNGVGMNEAQRQRVFEPFFTTKRNQGCSGLGMQIVYNLVHQLLGGGIRCQSAPEQGTTFAIEIPLQSPVRERAISNPALGSNAAPPDAAAPRKDR